MTRWIDPDENAVCDRYLSDGYVIAKPDPGLTSKLRDCVVLATRAALPNIADLPDEDDALLNQIHRWVRPDKLNAFRLSIFHAVNRSPSFRPTYYKVARSTLDVIVGNEVAIQRQVNLSIQLPGDDSSLLPVHTDTWSGDSAFEVVVWVPLVNCFDTKSMFLVEPEADATMQSTMAESFSGKSTEELYAAVAPHARFLDLPYGSILVFDQNIMHGNRINRTDETRWSLNCRFKSLLSPYAAKSLGEFFEPVFIRPATRRGMSYRLPEGFGDD